MLLLAYTDNCGYPSVIAANDATDLNQKLAKIANAGLLDHDLDNWTRFQLCETMGGPDLIEREWDFMPIPQMSS